MLSDINDRGDIVRLLEKFYEVVMVDNEIGHHFVTLDLEAHLPIITDFWEKILFGKPVYFNNPFLVHQELYERSPLLPEHFERWVKIFQETVDDLFAGPVAEDAKTKAGTIGSNLSQRLNGGVQIRPAS